MSTFMNITAWSSHSEETDPPSRASRSLGHLRNFSQTLSFVGTPQPKTYPDAPRRADLTTPHNVYDPDADDEICKIAIHSPSDSMSPIDDCDMSTLPDPREKTHSSSLSQYDRPTTSSTDAVADEITLISNKLVASINRQTVLGDALAASREEVRAAKETIARLEGVIIKQKEMVTGDVWIRKTAYEAEKCDLIAKIGQEKRTRIDAEKAKIAMERELEELSTALFNEANNLVITAKEEARKECDIVMKKNEQLKAQVIETENLLRDQQDQLAQLKIVMVQMDIDRDDHSVITSSSPRSSRMYASREDLTANDSRFLSPTATEHPPHVHAAHVHAAHAHAAAAIISPASPTTFTHLVTPVLNTDITAFDEFKALIHAAQTCNRHSGGSFSGSSFIGASLSVGGVAGGLTSSAASIMSCSATSAHSSSASSSTMAVPHLKDLKFFKRALVEDIDPTLRMDSAVHISWLARRSAHAAVIDGTLVVEPVHSNEPLTAISHPHYYPCSMCGEKRKSCEFLRTHRFRYNDSDAANRYPLCPYCLNRVRTTCEFIGFLRILKDGHWRSEDDEDEKAAWEESVRLREQMFWARIGGGVVPVQHQATISEHVRSSAPSVIGIIESENDYYEQDGDVSIPSIVASDYADAVSDAAAAQDDDQSTEAQETQEAQEAQDRRSADNNNLKISLQEEESDSTSNHDDDQDGLDRASVFGPDAVTPVVTDCPMEVKKGVDEMDLPTPMPRDHSEISFTLTESEPANSVRGGDDDDDEDDDDEEKEDKEEEEEEGKEEEEEKEKEKEKEVVEVVKVIEPPQVTEKKTCSVESDEASDPKTSLSISVPSIIPGGWSN